MDRKRTVGVLAAIGVLALMASGCSTGPLVTPSPKTTAVNVTLTEWAIGTSVSTAPAGQVRFSVVNQGPDDVHEFVVIKTDLAPDALPTVAEGDEAGTVDEEGEGFEAIGEKEDILAGTDGNVLTLTLTPGHYVIFCNVHDEELVHYQKGMHTEFTVS